MDRSTQSPLSRHLGRVSLALALGFWIGYYALLLVGGIDPSPALSGLLQTAVLVLLVVVLLALCSTSTRPSVIARTEAVRRPEGPRVGRGGCGSPGG